MTDFNVTQRDPNRLYVSADASPSYEAAVQRQFNADAKRMAKLEDTLQAVVNKLEVSVLPAMVPGDWRREEIVALIERIKSDLAEVKS